MRIEARAVALVVAAAVAWGEPVRREWTVEGAVREALVCAPEGACTNAAPVVFAFHGHGGSMHGAARSFPFHEIWPEAITVYMQGLPTPGRLTDPEGKRAGWQPVAGTLGDRDLKFFDAVLETLRTEYKVDEKRVFATGHSNGGGFTYVLWSARPHVFAAFAPCAAAALKVGLLKPKPALHVAGENDGLVKFAWQRATLDAVRALNGCAAEGRPWGERGTLYPSASGTPLVTLIHPGGHELPKGAAEQIARFFQSLPALGVPPL